MTSQNQSYTNSNTSSSNSLSFGKFASALRTNAYPTHQSSRSSGKLKFWKKNNNKTPGTIRQVRGAAYPPPTTTIHSPPSNRSDVDSPHIINDTRTHSHTFTNGIESHSETNGYLEKNHVNTPPIETNGFLNNHHQHTFSAPPNGVTDRNDKFYKKRRNLHRMLEEPNLDMRKLRTSCWRGIPPDSRPIMWKLLLGYMPRNSARRELQISRKRREYSGLIDNYYTRMANHRTDVEESVLRQIRLDVPRTAPMLRIFQIPCISELLERALYIWSHRHNASGYVQGINDLITPFVYIFLDDALHKMFNLTLNDGESRDIIPQLPDEIRFEIEADSYWCLSLLLEGLQRNYTHGQPGIQDMLQQLSDVVRRVNGPLYDHFQSQNLAFIQFSFRWMNCLLMRELTLQHTIRLWDTYLCEGVELSAGFSQFHVFVCAAILLTFADKLMEMEFQDMVLFLQALPTHEWNERDLETVLAEAYVYQQLFGDTKHHLQFNDSTENTNYY